MSLTRTTSQFASEDYSADVGITRTSTTQELLYARSAVVTHAAAYKISSIDMVCIQYKDAQQLAREARQGYGSSAKKKKKKKKTNHTSVVFKSFLTN